MRAFPAQGTLLPALSAGVAAGFLFSVSIGTESSGILFVSLPLLLIGLARGARLTALAGGIACLTAGLLSGPAGGLFIAAFVGFPAYYFVRCSLLWRGENASREWYPVLRLLSEMSLLASACFMTLAFAMRGQGGLQALVPHNLGVMPGADPELAAGMQQLTGELAFVLLALIAWLWILALYGLAVLANTVLKAKSHALRPSLAVEQTGIPVFQLIVLLISGALALLGAKTDRFNGDTVFLILLLPYLLSGLSGVHAFSVRRGIPFRKVWLACFYVVLACTRWPLLAVIALGLYLQLAEILDRRRKIR